MIEITPVVRTGNSSMLGISNRFAMGILAVIVMMTSGCQLMNTVGLQKVVVADAEHPVVEIIGVWQPGEGTGLDGLPCRGFAGQLLFFAMGEKSPVKVNGKVRIYVFDDQGTVQEQQQPIHQFDFDSGAFNAFYTQTNLGPAYQLFIPYTRKGNHAAACTLRVRFTPEEGASVYSKMATVILPGTTTRKPDQTIEQATHVSDPNQMMAEVFQAAALTTQTDGGNPIASVRAERQEEEAATINEDKKRLRQTLTEIAQITTTQSGRPRTVYAAGEEPQTFENGPPTTRVRLKLHPLNGHPVETHSPEVFEDDRPLTQGQPASQGNSPNPLEDTPGPTDESTESSRAASKDTATPGQAHEPLPPTTRHPLED
jgi:hypothetical protein